MVYKYRANPHPPRQVIGSMEDRIRSLAATETHLKHRIGELRQVEHSTRQRVRNNNQGARTTPPKTVDQVLEEARPILARLRMVYPEPPGLGAKRMAEILAEIDNHDFTPTKSNRRKTS